jgi:hypothetical protein
MDDLRHGEGNQPLGDLLHFEQYAADFEDDTDLMILVWICVICVIPGQNQISQYALLKRIGGTKWKNNLGTEHARHHRISEFRRIVL